MGSSFDDSGLRRLQQNLSQLKDTQSVPFPELFNADFMGKNTNYSSFEAMIEASPFEVKSAEDFKAIPDAEWEVFIRQATRFDSWQEMQKEAGVQWVRRKLMSGLG